MSQQSPSLIGTIKVILPNLGLQQFTQIKYNQKAALGLGITQMILGVLCIISNSVILATNLRLPFPSVIAYGFWGGIMFAIAGLLEVLSARKTPNRCLIIGSMVMSIGAALVSVIVFGLGITEAIIQDYSYRVYSKESLAFAIIMTISALAEIVISIIGSAVCCGTFCRKHSLIIPINVNMDGNQLVTSYQPNNSYYQALVKPSN